MKKILRYLLVQILQWLNIKTITAQRDYCEICDGYIIVSNTHGEPGTFLFCCNCNETGLKKLTKINLSEKDPEIFLISKNPHEKSRFPNGVSSNSRIYMMSTTASHRTIDHTFTSVTAAEYMMGKRPQKKSTMEVVEEGSEGNYIVTNMDIVQNN